MSWFSASREAVGLVAAAALVPLCAAFPAAGADSHAQSRVLHRVVWDEWKRNVHGGGGIHISSAKVDGTGVRHVYDSEVGFTMELTLDPRGRRVAFALCCRPRLPRMLVVPILGGAPVDPLARHPQISMVWGIGWSPDGRRLAFFGGRRPSDDGPLITSLWTVRVDGTGLRRVLSLPTDDDHQVSSYGSPIWTRSGIYFTDGFDLHAVHGGTSQVVLRHVPRVQVTGDHRRLLIARVHGERHSLWWGTSDGTLLRRMPYPDHDRSGASYYLPTPSYDGRSLLADRMRPDDASSPWVTETVSWTIADGRGSAEPLGWLPKMTMSRTWN